MSRKGIIGALPILFVLILLSIGGLLFYRYDLRKELVTISHESGIYAETFLLKIDTVRKATIFYTTDGTKPGSDNDSAMIYTEPIEIAAGTDTKVYSLQIKCEYTEKEESPVFKREFIMERQGASRYQTTYVVSVTGDEEALWGYERGIFTRGRRFDEFMESNPNVDINETCIPANYYSDEELPVHVSVFLNNGQELISKNCGIKIYGGWTRAKNQKSFRLYARNIYDEKNEFEYALLPILKSEKNRKVIDEFQRISFHNSGNDNGYAFIRSALIGRLADLYGFDDVLLSESAVVYVNGRYQGFYWIQNTYDDRYFKEKYGDHTGEMVICEGELDEMSGNEETTPVEHMCISEYNQFCRWIEEADINNEENWEYICRTIDILGFAKYMAIEYYIGNVDWPHNNVKIYRYVSNDGYEEDSVFDGRYRYLLFDTDYGFGLKFQDIYGYDENHQRLIQLCDKTGASGLFASMMQREEFRNLFVNSVLILMQSAFSSENVQMLLEEMSQSTVSEIQYMFEKTDLLKNSLWESDDNSFEHVKEEYQKIRTYAINRPAVVLEEMNRVFDCGELMKLSVCLRGEGIIEINGMELGERYEGYCYENIPMSISCKVPSTKSVKGFYVNGQYIEGKVLHLEGSQWKDCAGGLQIEPEIEEIPVKELSILCYDTDGKDDYIVLGNTGNVIINLSEYCLSDSSNASKGRLPEKWLKPGEVYYVYGKKYSGNMEKNGVKMSFSWNDEEDIILSNSEEGIISRY